MSIEGYLFKFLKPAKDFLVKEGYDQAYGARPIKRAIQRYVEDIVADAILDQALVKGKEYTITKNKDEDKLFIKL
jgi:ATP-dependent Clp protease ATP-binding subunit ClpC